RLVYHWLDHPPQELHHYRSYRYLLFDGTYFHKRGCLIIMMESTSQQILIRDYVDKESYDNVYPLLLQLKEQGLNPLSVTVDGHPRVIEAFKAVWPNLLIQRCLYHIQRQGLSWIRLFPKTQAGKELRIIL